jgi:ribosomal protein S18 acetylase RimI-like enzyme
VQELHVRHHPQVFKPFADAGVVEAFFEKELGDPDNHFFVARAGREPIGYLWARVELLPEDPLLQGLLRVYVHHLGVREDWRRRGIGGRLLARALRLSRLQGAQQVVLDAWAFNREARRFFKDHGFETCALKMWRRSRSP